MSDGIIIGLIVGGINVAVTTIIGLIVTAWWNKRQKEKDELQRLRDHEFEERENNRCSAMKTAVHEEIADLETKLSKDIKNIDSDLDSMKKAMQKDVRRSLRQDGKMYIDRGWATDLEKTEFDELYWSYHNLGKNGVVDALHEQVMHLPSAPQDN